eukprot:TRINITY_DN19775_c0_g1_i1.p1 TRINITY_DN19775_c0_g1~~TRINITY_DN19775_c0_g1_i1.p1  ORF type:complete len:293 (-),score=91.16 TRINITY_DN19775_c0_g1_i1:35-856(-)
MCIRDRATREQNLLNKAGAPTILMELFCRENVHEQHFNTGIVLAIRLLDGGNIHVQQSFYDFLVNSETTELFFARLQSFFDAEIKEMTEGVDTRGVKRLMKGISESYRTTNVGIRDVLRLLQLFTEGHFREMQDLVRYQRASRQNISIPDLVVNLMKQLITHESRRNYEILIQAFDTLTEFVQGPCVENQRTLADGKFLDIAVLLLQRYPRGGRAQMLPGIIGNFLRTKVAGGSKKKSKETKGELLSMFERISPNVTEPVSYTHLTLPTIYSV